VWVAPQVAVSVAVKAAEPLPRAADGLPGLAPQLAQRPPTTADEFRTSGRVRQTVGASEGGFVPGIEVIVLVAMLAACVSRGPGRCASVDAISAILEPDDGEAYFWAQRPRPTPPTQRSAHFGPVTVP
jgi:hypothetical protein